MPLKLPFHTSISDGLYPSRVITVSGTVLQNAKSFYIDLCTESDIAFRFTPRLDENTVVWNTEIQGVWGTEERDLPFGMPFRREHSFTQATETVPLGIRVEIICEADHYSVSVDGQHLLDYVHRLKDLPAIDRLTVDGDLELNSVNV
ncbi:galectin-9-like [Octodon degus]|uniref:Galectin n=1 Tax=Octodon degus TaxID=10160 RepID=A0A6P6ETG5_OCTDE|nr:galectin-9-like [Octodon degus]